MNDKLKGLALGLSLGVLLTGSVAYAGGAQIEVYFNSLKYMFDGVEKKPADDQAGFIYNGSTYVPLRFVSEALGKEVTYDEASQTIRVGKQIDLAASIATFQGQSLTLKELDDYLKVGKFFDQRLASYESDPAYKEYSLKQLIGYKVLAARVSDAEKPAVTLKVDKQLENIKSQHPQEHFAAELAKAGISEAQVRAHLTLVLSADQALSGADTEKALKAEYDKKVKENAGELVVASVRHILVGLEPGTGKKRTKEEAKAEAQKIVERLKKGEDFAELAKQLTDDPGSKDSGGLYPDAEVDQWVPAFKKAALEQAVNVIGDPVETEYGYHVIRVEKRESKTFEQAKPELRKQYYEQFMDKELPKLIERSELPKQY